MSAWFALFILALSAVLLVQNHPDGIAGIDNATFAAIAAGLSMLIFMGGRFLTSYSGQSAAFLRDALTWLALGLALVTIYSYRGELLPMAGRLAGEIIPGSAMVIENNPNGPAEVKIRKRLDGHFTAKAEINGQPITTIVDTGASTIVLRPEDAAKAGIDVADLAYTVPVMTANGSTLAARVRLKEVAIGPLSRRDVDALVAKPNSLRESLLGMSFLSRLRSYEFSGDFLTLRG